MRLLGSDQPGEVVAAAAALKRALARVGADLHDLAGTIERPAAAVMDVPKVKPRRGRKPRAGDIDFDFARRRNVVEALRRGLAGGRMTEWERAFAGSLVEQMQGQRWRLTERQGEKLSRLLGKIGEGSAWA